MRKINTIQGLDDIVISFENIEDIPKSLDSEKIEVEFAQRRLFGVSDVGWCSLPNLLVRNGALIGLSFPILVTDDKLRAVEEHISVFDNVRILSALSNYEYDPEGANKKLELYFGNVNEPTHWIPASLFEGYWLFSEEEIASESFLRPSGYWLSCVSSIREYYKLK